MAQILIILNDAPYGSERCYNGLRVAGGLARRGSEQVKVFLIGDAAAAAKAGQKVPSGYYNIETMLKAAARHGAEIGVCGSCLDARAISEAELAEGSRRSTLEQLADWTVWAAKVITF